MKRSLESYVLRSYEEGDEFELATLFNEAHRSYAGFMPRTPEYWRWNCLNRPDVTKDGVIIVVNERKIVAYAVVGQSGNIWELCLDRSHNTEALVSLILEKAVDYLANFGAESATLNIPSEDSVARKAFEKLGFVKVPAHTMFLSVLDFERLVQLLSKAEEEALQDFSEDLCINFKDAPFWISPQVTMRNEKRTKLNVESRPRSARVLIETDTITFASILLGNTRPLSALLRFKLKIRPITKIGKVLKLLSVLRLKDPWFFPSSDFG